MCYVLFQLPDKSIAALVRYYYSWKKTRARSSLMDRQVRRLTQRAGEETNNAENSEPASGAAAAATVPSDSDEEKNDVVRAHVIIRSCTNPQCSFFGFFTEGW